MKSLDEILEKHSTFWYIVGMHDESKTSNKRLSTEQASRNISIKSQTSFLRNN